VAVNPDRELARLAKARGWEVRSFEHRVPLRDRVAMPPRRVVFGAAALSSVAAVAGAAAWWWLRLRRPTVPLTRRQRATARVAGARASLSERRPRRPPAASGAPRGR
jgi:hypothetical protein